MKIDVVILAAGKGNRLKPITDKTPKSLIKIGGECILKKTLDGLDPNKVGDVFIITKHLEEKIENFIEKNRKKYLFNIIKISQGKIKGTYGALASVKKLLSGWFIVINGDDIHSAKDLKKFFKEKNQIGVSKKESKYFEVIFDKNKNFKKFKRDSQNKKRFIATGCYTLNKEFFNFKPEKTSEGEFGIPQTIESNISKIKPKVVIENNWDQLNTHQDLDYLREKYLIPNT